METTKQLTDGSEWFETVEEPQHFSEAEVDGAALAKIAGPRDAQKKKKK